MSRKAVSLFCSSGIGDLGIHANNIETVIASELLEERAKLFLTNNPNTKLFIGDIWNEKQNIINEYKEKYKENPFLILATPPCQGMSSNGMGKMLNDFRKGLRPKMDERNRLIIPTVEIIQELQPDWVILENVPNMQNTLILDENEELINIVEYVFKKLGNYVGISKVVEVADYGVPQNRKRLITILTKLDSVKMKVNSEEEFFPQITHNKLGQEGLKKWVTLFDAIGHLPNLDAVKGKNKNNIGLTYHEVPVLDPKKYEWIRHTPEGETAFNNQCINPECSFQGNMKHGASVKNGINQSHTNTPLYCEKCNQLLPRPYVEDKKTGELRLMKGFVSAYKRMNYSIPASTLTQNFQFVSSDNKIHPTQNRVLSIYEALILQTISNYDYKFEINGKKVSDTLIRETIGESVPPLLTELLIKRIIELSK